MRLLLQAEIADPTSRRRPENDGFFRKLFAPLQDRTTWKELTYLWLVQPVLSIVNFTVSVTAWAVAVWAVTVPIYAIEWPGAAPEVWDGRRLDTPIETLPLAIAGLLLLPLVPWIIRGLTHIDAATARGMLSPSRQDALEEKIDTLRETQARSVDMAMADRRQIERDLHDGAQQRLLALGMSLGMALEKFESEPEAARGLVDDAHHELQRAVAELRNLARGVHPAVLTDRGLDAALSALAARSPVPVRLDVHLPERPPASVEATAYFIVAEGLTNAARYANASAVDVHVRRVGDRLQEDSVLLRDGLVCMLNDHGHEVVAAVQDAAEVISLVQRESPDIAILDVRMPPTHTDEGIRAALELRSRWPHLAVLMLSQYVEENTPASSCPATSAAWSTS